MLSFSKKNHPHRSILSQSEEIGDVVPEDAAVLVFVQSHFEHAVDLRLCVPHGIIGAEHHPVRTPGPDQCLASLTTQRVESGGCVHGDIVEVRKHPDGVIPYAPAAEVRADELQLRKCAQDINNPVRIGTVKAMVPGVHQNRKACRLTELKDVHGFVRIGLKALEIRMKLYASEAQVHQLADVLFRVRRIRMQRAQSRERPVRLCNFGRDKAVDAGDLMRRGGNRVDQIMGDPHLPADLMLEI